MNDHSPVADGHGEHEELDDLFDQLEELERTVDDPDEREQVEQTMRLARRIPVSGRVAQHISKYTSRDVAETFVGGIILSLPLLVEDGVFDIAEWLARTEQFGIDFGVPVFLLANVAFIVVFTICLLYWSDFRELQDPDPIFGLVPHRLVGVLGVSLVTATFLMVLWGRHTEADPTVLETLGRIAVIWAAAAFGGALGDIIPGESEGTDLRVENVDELVGLDD